MRPLAVHHVSLNVTDVDEAVAFYTEVLGGSVRSDRPELGIGGAWLDLGATQVHLIEAPVPPSLGQHLALHLEQLDAAVAELRERGLEVADPMVVGTDRQTFVEDPSGNLVELHEVGAVAAG